MNARVDAAEGLLATLTELETLITTARSMPMSASAIVNRQEALDLIERLRHAVPQTLHHAQDIMKDAESTLAQGREEAQKIIAHAQDQAERLVSSENVVRQANDRADAIIAAAEAQAEQLRYGADDYCDRALANLEIELGKLTEQARSGRQLLEERLEKSAAHNSGAQATTTRTRRHGQGAFKGWSVDPRAQE